MSKEKRANAKDNDLARAQNQLDKILAEHGDILREGQRLEAILKDYVAEKQAEYQEKKYVYDEYIRLGRSGEPVKEPHWQPLGDAYYIYARVPLPEAAAYKALLPNNYQGNKELRAKYGEWNLMTARSAYADAADALWNEQRQWNDVQAQIDFEYELDECTELERKIANLFCKEEGYAVALDVLKELKEYKSGKGK